jgi:hypothetical protein
MSLPVIVRPDAEADIRAIRAQLDVIRDGLGDRFAIRLQDVLERIEFMPRHVRRGLEGRSRRSCEEVSIRRVLR